MSTVDDARVSPEQYLSRSSVPGQTWFTTESVPPTRRIAEWEAHHATALVGLRAQLGRNGELHAETATVGLPRIRVAKVVGSPHAVRRQAADIATHPVAGAVAYFPLAGTSAFAHRTGRAVIGPENALICDGDTEFTRNLSAGVNELVVHLPRVVLRELTGSSSIRRPSPIALGAKREQFVASREFSKLADGMLSQRLRGGEQLESRLLELLGTMLSCSLAEQTLTQDAFSAIQECHRNPEFTAVELARQMGISVRQLSRLFGEAELSVPQAVLEARLETAHKMLSDESSSETSMAEIASLSGFRSQAQFSRTYRARYGISPLRHRKQMLNSES